MGLTLAIGCGGQGTNEPPSTAPVIAHAAPEAAEPTAEPAAEAPSAAPEGSTGEPTTAEAPTEAPAQDAVPEPAGPPSPGTVRGRILRDGEPLANAEVQICPNPVMQIGSGRPAPCEGPDENEWLAFGRTDEQGRFELSRVRAARATIVVDTGRRRWRAVRPATGTCCAGAAQGLDIGDASPGR